MITREELLKQIIDLLEDQWYLLEMVHHKSTMMEKEYIQFGDYIKTKTKEIEKLQNEEYVSTDLSIEDLFESYCEEYNLDYDFFNVNGVYMNHETYKAFILYKNLYKKTL